MVAVFMACSAFAAERPSVATDMAPWEQALIAALAEEGMDRLISVEVEVDAAGQAWLTVAAEDKAEIADLAPRSDAETVLVGTIYERTVPLWLFEGGQAAPTETLSLNFVGPGDWGGGGGGGGGSEDECVEVCVCTEQGAECWIEC